MAAIPVRNTFSSRLQQKQEKTDHSINKRKEAYLSFITSSPRINSPGLMSIVTRPLGIQDLSTFLRHDLSREVSILMLIPLLAPDEC
jgi:hypothetical protein